MSKLKIQKKVRNLTQKEVDLLEVGDDLSFDDISDLSMVARDNYRNIDKNHVETLKTSILASGVLQRITLRLDIEDDGSRHLRCVSGHHRLEAVMSLRIEALDKEEPWLYRPLPCFVEVKKINQGEHKTTLQAVISNTVVKKESLMDRVHAVKKMKKAGMSHQLISAALGLERKSIERAVSVSEIPNEILELISSSNKEVKDSKIYALASLNRSLMNSVRIEDRISNLKNELYRITEEKKLSVVTKSEPVAKSAPAENILSGEKAPKLKKRRDPKNNIGLVDSFEEVRAVLREYCDEKTANLIEAKLVPIFKRA